MNLQEFNAYVKKQSAPKPTSTATSSRTSSRSGGSGLRARLRDSNDRNARQERSTRNAAKNPGFKSAKSGFRSKSAAKVVKDAPPAPDTADDVLFPSLCVTENGDEALTAIPVSLGNWSNGIDTIIAAKDIVQETKSRNTRRRRYSEYSEDSYYSQDEAEYEKEQHDSNSNSKSKANTNEDSDADWDNL